MLGPAVHSSAVDAVAAVAAAVVGANAAVSHWRADGRCRECCCKSDVADPFSMLPMLSFDIFDMTDFHISMSNSDISR